MPVLKSMQLFTVWQNQDFLAICPLIDEISIEAGLHLPNYSQYSTKM